MYVTSPNGLRVRSEPSLSSKTIDALYYGEYVLVDKVGEKTTIDGITANWIRVKFYDDDEFPEANGWVFGGYLSKEQPELGKDAFSFIKDYFKRSKKDVYLASFFPEEHGTVYFRNEANWENQHPDYDCALENLCQENYYPDSKAVTIRECMYYQPPVAACLVGSIAMLPEGTQIELSETGEYGEKAGVLFPIYWFNGKDEKTGYQIEGYIRGIDITSTKHTSSVSDGRGGKYTLYYQRALKSVNSDNCGFNKSEVDDALGHYFTYEMSYLKGGFKMSCIVITDPAGKRYDVDPESLKNSTSEMGNAHSMALEYPLNMKNPVLFLKESFFGGGMGGGYFSEKLSTAELKNGGAILRKTFEHGYLSVDAGLDGMAYHYFSKSGAFVYEYQTDEMGNVEHNRQIFYEQKENSPYAFWDGESISREPQGKSQTFKKGQYVNPICRLKMRMSPVLSASTICLLKPGTLLKIVEVGDKETIDGISANWVKVQPVNDDVSVEGEILKESFPAEETSAWVFGGYLE